ncbi:hypothetical protein Q7P35_005494 [Cladosporium inversicolor]
MALMDSFLGSFGSRPTDKVTLYPTNPAFSKSTCPDDFKIYGRQYTRKSALARGHRSRERRSPIWRFGEDIVCVNDGIDVYYCWICECEKKRQDLPVLKGNSSALNHMMSHGYDRDSNKTEKSTKTIPETRTFYALVTTTKYESFKTLLVRWIVYCQVAFVMLENEYFRELLACLNQSIADLLPRARATLRGWIIDEYVDRKAALKDELAEAISDIHLSFDLWTAPNYMSILDEFQIQERIGCLVGDNAASNDTTVSTILKALYPKLTKRQQTAFRIRCFGHIVNLCAYTLIFGKGKGNRREAFARAERKGDKDG